MNKTATISGGGGGGGGEKHTCACSDLELQREGTRRNERGTDIHGGFSFSTQHHLFYFVNLERYNLGSAGAIADQFPSKALAA